MSKHVLNQVPADGLRDQLVESLGQAHYHLQPDAEVIEGLRAMTTLIKNYFEYMLKAEARLDRKLTECDKQIAKAIYQVNKLKREALQK